jgi:hypothetical protein
MTRRSINPDPWPNTVQEQEERVSDYLSEEQRLRRSRFGIENGKPFVIRDRSKAIDYTMPGSPPILRTVEIVEGFWVPLHEARPYAPPHGRDG